MLTKEDAAAVLNGNEYGSEGSPELFAEMKAAGLVAVFGASDDLTEWLGAIEDETGMGIVPLNRSGIILSECDRGGDDCPYFLRLIENAATVDPQWDDGSGFSWRYKTEIPHAKFVIVESFDAGEMEQYCEGIVFALADVPS